MERISARDQRGSGAISIRCVVAVSVPQFVAATLLNWWEALS